MRPEVHRRTAPPAGRNSPGSRAAVPVLMCWSGGKDSAMALYRLLQQDGLRPVGLLTTVTEAHDRISMHGVWRALLRRQARLLGLPLDEVILSPTSSNAEYEARMEEILLRWKRKGVNSVAFGDIFLEDLRKYREENVKRVGMGALFPLWGQDTRQLFRQFLALGFSAVVTCVDARALPRDFAGRYLDEGFLSDLPHGVDPCGENGEFHSFVVQGPVLQSPLPVTVGERVLREGFSFCDLVPA